MLLNGGIYGRLHRLQRTHRLLMTPILGPLAARLVTPRALARGLNAIAGRADAWTLADAAEHLRAMAANGGLHRLPRLVHYIEDRKRFAPRWETAMEAASGKIAFVWGPEDPVSGAHMLAEARRRMPAARFDALEGVGHYPHWEAPALTAAAILASLEG